MLMPQAPPPPAVDQCRDLRLPSRRPSSPGTRTGAGPAARTGWIQDPRRVGLHSAVMSETPTELQSAVRAALAKVIDPELRRPITELGMVKNVSVDADGGVHVEIYLTTSACPKKTEISERVSRSSPMCPAPAPSRSALT